MMKLALAAALLLASAGSARAADAAALFKQKCAACHGADGKGQTAMGKKLGVKDLAHLKEGEAAIEKIIADGKPGTKMLGFKGKVADDELKALAAYVKGGLK